MIPFNNRYYTFLKITCYYSNEKMSPLNNRYHTLEYNTRFKKNITTSILYIKWKYEIV